MSVCTYVLHLQLYAHALIYTCIDTYKTHRQTAAALGFRIEKENRRYLHGVRQIDLTVSWRLAGRKANRVLLLLCSIGTEVKRGYLHGVDRRDSFIMRRNKHLPLLVGIPKVLHRKSLKREKRRRDTEKEKR